MPTPNITVAGPYPPPDRDAVDLGAVSAHLTALMATMQFPGPPGAPPRAVRVRHTNAHAAVADVWLPLCECCRTRAAAHYRECRDLVLGRDAWPMPPSVMFGWPITAPGHTLAGRRVALDSTGRPADPADHDFASRTGRRLIACASHSRDGYLAAYPYDEYAARLQHQRAFHPELKGTP